MENLNVFLEGLTDEELAKFIAYRYKGFMSVSQGIIVDEVKRRNLNHTNLKRLYSEEHIKRKDVKDICEQCGCQSFFTETDYELRHKQYYSVEVAVESNRCRICGYNPEKNGSGFLHSIKKAFGLYRTTRRKTPEIDGKMFT